MSGANGQSEALPPLTYPPPELDQFPPLRGFTIPNWYTPICVPKTSLRLARFCLSISSNSFTVWRNTCFETPLTYRAGRQASGQICPVGPRVPFSQVAIYTKVIDKMKRMAVSCRSEEHTSELQ